MELLVCVENNQAAKNSFVNLVDIATGQSLVTFKSSSATSGTLCCVKGDYVVHAVDKKAVLHIFEINRSGQQAKKVVVPGVVNALCVSIDGCLVAAGIDEKVLIWDLCNGQLLAILSKHYQKVTAVKFTDDSSFLVSAGTDGLVIAWDVSEVLNGSNGIQEVQPKCSIMAHALPVTDLCVSPTGQNSPRIYSCSGDRTVKIHDLCSGRTMLTLVFDSGVSCLTVDNTETMVCVGGTSGIIYKVDLISMAHQNRAQIDFDSHSKDQHTNSIKAHTNCILTISFNSDCSLIISTAKHEPVKIWDVASGQCIRSIKSVSGNQSTTTTSNVDVILKPARLSVPGPKPLFPFPKLAHVVNKEEDAFVCGRIIGLQESSNNRLGVDLVDDFNTGSVESSAKVQEEIQRLKEQNRSLYNFALRQVVSES